MAGGRRAAPVFLVGLVVLVVNDHVLKRRVPGAMTGKLSDLAGLTIFPMLVVAVVEVAHWFGGRQEWRATSATFAASAVATVGGFAAIKTIGPVGDLYRTTLGWSQWMLSAVPRFLVGGDVGVPHRAELIADRSDLIAAPMVLISLWIGSRLRGSRPDPTRTETGN